MSQQHEQYYVGFPSKESRVTAQAFKAVQTGVIIREKDHADVMQTGIIIHDAARNDLLNTGVIVHDADSQRDGEVDSQGDGGAERNTQLHQPTIVSWLGDFYCWFVDSLSFSSELQVRQKRDRDSNLCWDIYDPITKRSARLSSESEVRIWIEQSYQRQFR